ncbi:MAG: glucosaminidase domain-containing protein [Bacteroidales bacterium]|nr:glucosaminidase domain-containing protein [Bacteroidales bacterium]
MRFIFTVLLTGFCFLVQGQNGGKKITRAEYIETYKGLAMEEMKRTGIPASIKLAQGLLESGNGNSSLATKANNHFGIKCHNWNGPSVNHDDDRKNECFRKYKSAAESYRDHSDFLTTRSRYASLFELRPDDYKAWAKGLKEAGYATSPTYSKALVAIIEDNELYVYDRQVMASAKDIGRTRQKQRARLESDVSLLTGNREVLFNNRVKYIVADSNDTFSKLTEQLHFMSWQLTRYNELPENAPLKKGDFVYLQPKRNRAAAGHKTHIIKEGETLHSVSQLYGVKEQKLRVRNNIPENAEPKPGATILLRGKTNVGAPWVQVKQKPDEKLKEIEKAEGAEFIIEFDLGN